MHCIVAFVCIANVQSQNSLHHPKTIQQSLEGANKWIIQKKQLTSTIKSNFMTQRQTEAPLKSQDVV